MGESGKPILIITLAPKGKCNNCDQYKSEVEKPLIKKLKGDGRVDIIQLTVVGNTPGKRIEGEYVHPRLNSWITWWPSFILVTHSSWNNERAPLQGAVYGGRLSKEEKWIENPGSYDYTSIEKISTWIDEVLRTPVFALPLSSKPKYGEYEFQFDNRSRDTARSTDPFR